MRGKIRTRNKHSKRARRPYVQVILAFIVVLITSFALSLNAITMDEDPIENDVAVTAPTEEELIEEVEEDVVEEPVVEEKAVEPVGASGTGIGNATNFANLKNGGTYYLTADLEISNTVNIANTTTLDLNGHNIIVKCAPLFSVSSGSLTIKDSQASITEKEASGMGAGTLGTYSGGTLTYYVTKSTVKDTVNGLTEEKWYRNTASTGLIVGNKSDGRAITISGGTLNLQSGCICNFTSSNEGGAIYASEGTINLSGAVIAANTSSRGGAIAATGSATVNISGGAISGNKSTGSNLGDERGGGGMFISGEKVTLNMSGGYITNNYNEYNGYRSGGGGVEVRSRAIFNLTDGYITANKSEGGGGGIIVYDWGDCKTGGQLIMSGGFISANTCYKAEGAGVNLNAGAYMEATAGYITNNILGGGAEVEGFQDWGGGGIFCAENSATLNIQRVLITANKAGGYGGGVAGCATGRITMVPKLGAGIFDNTALGEHMSGSGSTKNQDHTYAYQSEVFTSHGYKDFFSALSTSLSGEMLGGGEARWNGSSDGVPVATTATTDVITGTYVTGLTCEASDDAKNDARDLARLFITGNESPTHGGGILVNGHMVVGVVEQFDIPARLELDAGKKLFDENGMPVNVEGYNFKFIVEDEYGNEVSTATANAAGQLVFSRMLPFAYAGTFTYYLYEEKPSDSTVRMDTSRYKIIVTVKEEKSGTVPGLTVPRIQYLFTNVTIYDISKGEDSGSRVELYNQDPGNDEAHAVHVSIKKKNGDAAFTNRIVGKDVPLQITVNKKWSKTPEVSSVEVELLKDGKRYGNTVTLSPHPVGNIHGQDLLTMQTTQ